MTNAARRLIIPAVAAVVAVASVAAPAMGQTGTDAPENAAAADLVATQVREQGYACDDPTKAKRDQDSGEADDAVWVLTCKNASYRVRLVPDMAADVEHID